MKELSIKEKAKRYDEAIERAKELLEIGVKDTRDKRVVLSFFPELKESEPNWCHHKVDLSNCSEEYRKAYYDGWNNCNIQHSLCEQKMDEQGKHGTTEKSEHEFNIGDWIIRNSDYGIPIQVIAFKEFYFCKINGEIVELTPNDVHKNFHLWTIEDAKDGDVLCSLFHHLIWIYKDSGQYYACVNMNYTTENINTNGLINIPNDVRPATKDEQIILFEKMKEAGYKWNANKKELIKL